MVSELSYMGTSSQSIEQQNVTFSLLYPLFQEDDFTTLVGGVVGYGSFELKNYTYSTPSSSALYGIQVTQLYSITSNFSMVLNYKALWNHYSISIEGGEDYTTTLSNNFTGGIRYSF
jgi:hypothetical protein